MLFMTFPSQNLPVAVKANLHFGSTKQPVPSRTGPSHATAHGNQGSATPGSIMEVPDMGVPPNHPFLDSLDWFKGSFTGKPHI